jgi:hypothetical protein
MGKIRFEYGFEFAEKIEIIVGSHLSRSNRDRGSRSAVSDRLRKRLKKFQQNYFYTER